MNKLTPVNFFLIMASAVAVGTVLATYLADIITPVV